MGSVGRLTIRHAAAAGLVLVVSAGCATKADVQDLQRSMVSEIRRIETGQRALLARIGIAFDSIGVQEERELTGRGELQRQFDRLGDLLAQLLELVGQNNRLLTEMRSAQTVQPARLPALERPGGDSQGAVAAGQADEATVFYNAALGQYRRGAYETARSGFLDFLLNYPDHELAPDAQYFVAETYASEGDLESALSELSKVGEGWSDSPRAATALYRSGILEVKRGRLSDARVYFQRVLDGYPGSAEAPLAEGELKSIRR